jgi:class 3 adenylate cyclase
MPNILIVDDEPQNLNALRRVLADRSPSWTVCTAGGEAEALALLGRHPFDVVITDLVMATEQSGMEVLRQAKAKDPFSMVILITAFEKQLDRYRAFELGAFDCVQKNTPNVIAAEEIYVKTRAALRFRELTLEQIENQKRLAFLRRYFDPRVFGVLEKNPELLNIRNDTITVSFWDMRGFSRLCESLKAHPALVAGFLREFSKEAAEVIFEHHGVLDKYIGDGVMGLFGAINHRNDGGRQDAIHAVGAAMSMMPRFNTLLATWTEQFTLYTPQTVELGLGCGIHTGEALVGNVGTELRDHYTALGANVNFAQRIEARSGKSQILISSTTEGRVKDHFDLQELEVIRDVKNIPGEFRIYSVLAARAHAK